MFALGKNIDDKENMTPPGGDTTNEELSTSRYQLPQIVRTTNELLELKRHQKVIVIYLYLNDRSISSLCSCLLTIFQDQNSAIRLMKSKT